MTAQYKTLELARDGAVATVWMNRPEVFNAFDEQLIAELTELCCQLDHDDSVRVVVLAGRGRHFSAGADLNWMKAAGEAGEAEEILRADVYLDVIAQTRSAFPVLRDRRL